MFWLLYQLHVNYALHQALKSEKVKNIKYRELNMACDQKLVEVKKESIAKDNRTAEIWNKLGWLLNFFPFKFIFKLLDGKKKAWNSISYLKSCLQFTFLVILSPVLKS